MDSNANIKFVPLKLTGFKEDINDDEFNFFCRLIEDTIGITLGPGKKALVTSRLSKRLRTLCLDSYTDYIHYLQQDDGELNHFVNALTTNKTEFFRESSHFDYLKSFYLNTNTHKLVYIWSAACSNGAEVYTTAMVLNEVKDYHPGLEYRILGTDIDSQMLARSEKGSYYRSELDGVPSPYFKKYFRAKSGQNNSILYHIAPYLRESIKFRPHNLIDSSDLPLKFDVIFLRNVLIYFSSANIQRVINKMARHLKPKGLLFIGHSENLTTVSHDFKQIGSSIFRKS